jgi:hypothetical protein
VDILGDLQDSKACVGFGLFLKTHIHRKASVNLKKLMHKPDFGANLGEENGKCIHGIG